MSRRRQHWTSCWLVQELRPVTVNTVLYTAGDLHSVRIMWKNTSVHFWIYRVRHKKQPPKKNSISQKPCNLNSWNLHHIILRNTTVFSEKFFHIIHMKQKLQLSELKKDNFATGRRTQHHWRRTGLAEIAQSLSGRKSSHRIRLISTLLTIICGVWCLTSINAMYQSQRTFRSWRPSWRRSGLTCHKAQLMKQYSHSQKASGMH